MISGLRSFVVIGLITFIVGVIVTFPARVAYRWFASPNLQLAGIGGTIWSGSAREFAAGSVYFRDLHWRARPFSLLTGRLGLSIEARPASGFVEADVTLTPGGSIIASDLRASLPLQMLAPMLNMPGLAGGASVEIGRLRLEDGVPVQAEGTIAVSGLVAPLIDPAPIGSYRMEFVNNDSGVIASVEDTAGVFDLAGTLTIRTDRSYEFLGLVAATDQTPDKLRGQLRFLGSPNDRGQHELRLEGSL